MDLIKRLRHIFNLYLSYIYNKNRERVILIIALIYFAVDFAWLEWGTLPEDIE